MSTFVTLAEVLESRGAPLEEDEVWALLLGAAEALMSISNKGSAKPCSIISPGSMLLSASGSIAFKTCSRSEDVASFTSPEMVLARTSSSRQDVEKMVVFSLGMTLYWTADYQLPQNQPVQLSNHLNSLLLKMCEEAALRRLDLLAVLEESEQHHKNALLPPPDTVIRQLVQDVLQDPAENALGNTIHLTDRSQLVRDRLRGSSSQNSAWAPKGNGLPLLAFPAETNRSNQGSNPSSISSSTWQIRSPNLSRRQQINSKPDQSFDSSFSLSEKKLKVSPLCV
uniref:KIND domain-containing protein n=1 Tax=Astyanax mexicanus TaxID=7994 RepID=A0A3B1JE31_ASTMX